MTEDKLLEQVRNAKKGDSRSLESLIVKIQDDIFSLCLRVKYDSELAKDLTQEILIKVITHLASFEERSSFRTWYYKITMNHIKDTSKRAFMKMTFVEFEEDLSHGMENLSPEQVNSIETQYQLEEVRLSCTHALLQVLNEDERIAYILGEIFMLDAGECSEILSITKATFRKRLQRSRDKILSFATKNCGIVDTNNKCSCPKRLKTAQRKNRLENGFTHYSSSKLLYSEILEKVKDLKEDQKVVAGYRLFEPKLQVSFSTNIEKLVKKYC